MKTSQKLQMGAGTKSELGHGPKKHYYWPTTTTTTTYLIHTSTMKTPFCTIIIPFFFFLSAVSSSSRSCHLEFQNESGQDLSIDWLGPGGTVVTLAEHVTDKIAFDSFVNHTFRLRTTDAIADRNETAVVATEGDQVVVVKVGLEIDQYLVTEPENDYKNEGANSVNFTHSCSHRAKQQLSRGVSVDTVHQSFLDCTEAAAAAILEAQSSVLSLETELLKSVSAKLENYTCADATRETTEPVAIQKWSHDGVTRPVGILHNRPASQIHIIENFISPEECQAVQDAAASTLHRGTVADGKGGSRLSESRKAWQAGVSVHDGMDPRHPLMTLKRRIFDYAQHAVGFGMELPGQEDIMSIQYFGNGESDPSPDRYTPHCDGDCNGRKAKKGARVATIVAYCDVPELGGGTNFQNANVFVKPKVGAAAFFSYMDPEKRAHDEGFTSHSGCPVLKGKKRIAVQWMRVGVDIEAPWDSFDTNTVSKKTRDVS